MRTGLVLGLVALFACGSVRAEVEYPYVYELEPFASYVEIPEVLKKCVKQPESKYYFLSSYEYFLTCTFGYVRENGEGLTNYSQTDLEKKSADKIEELSKFFSTLLATYDVNGDEAITIAEISAASSAKNPDQLAEYEENIEKLKAMDRNMDRRITVDEIAMPPDSLRKKILEDHLEEGRQFHQLDVNNDDVVTLMELEHLARKTYATIDSDADGILSLEEYGRYIDALRAKAPKPRIINSPF